MATLSYSLCPFFILLIYVPCASCLFTKRQFQTYHFFFFFSISLLCIPLSSIHTDTFLTLWFYVSRICKEEKISDICLSLAWPISLFSGCIYFSTNGIISLVFMTKQKPLCLYHIFSVYLMMDT